MCILFLAIQQHPDFPLIICANRDEFHQRPTRAAGFWPHQPDVLAGQDLQAGGTWLGVNRSGYYAAVTNIRTGVAADTSKLSRGALVTRTLQQDTDISPDWLAQHADQYNAFNLIYGNSSDMYCFNSMTKSQVVLTKGFHAISNGRLDDIWPKMARGEQKLEAILSSETSVCPQQLLAVLQDQTKAPDEQLPDTGIPAEWEKLLSSIFICSDEYGTRSSTIILQNRDHIIDFTEAQYDPQGKQTGQNHYSFRLNRL